MNVFELSSTISLKGMEKVDTQLSGLQKKLESVGKKFSSVGKGMTLAGGAMLGAVAAIGGPSLKMAADFDTAMREVNTMLLLNEEEFRTLSENTQDLARNMGVDAPEAAKALYQAISAGVPKGNALEFLEVATKAAIGGVTGTETAVDGLTTVLNAFKLPISNAQKVADLMFTTVKGGKTTFDELSASLFQVAPIAAASGVKFGEVSAALATMTKQGVPTSVATTQLRAAMVALQKPTADMQNAIEDMGYESGQAMLDELGLAGTLNKLRDATGGSTDKLMKMIGPMEAGAAVLALTGKNAQMFADDLAAMEESSGAAEDAFTQMEKSTSRQMAVLMSGVKDVGITIGNALMPVLKSLMEKIMPIIEKIGAWIKENPKLVKTILVVVGVVGSLLVTLGPVFMILGSLIPMLPILGGAFAALLGPIGIIIAAIAALIAIGVLVWKNWDTIKEKAIAIWDGIVNFFKGVWKGIVNIFKEHWDKILAVLFPVVGIPVLIARQWNGIVNFFKGVWKGIVNIFKEHWDKIKTYVKELWDKVTGIIRDWWEGIKEFLGKLNPWTWLKEKWNAVVTSVEGVWDSVTGVIEKWWEDMTKFFGNLNPWTWMKKTWNAVVTSVKGVWDKVTGVISDWWEGIKIFLGNLNPWEWMKKGWEKVKEGIGGILDFIFGGSMVEEWTGGLKNYFATQDLGPSGEKMFETLRQATADKLDEITYITKQEIGELGTWLGDQILPPPTIETPVMPIPETPVMPIPEIPGGPGEPVPHPEFSTPWPELPEATRDPGEIHISEARGVIPGAIFEELARMKWVHPATPSFTYEEAVRSWGLEGAARILSAAGAPVYFKKGGIITKPTLAMLGETGPEAVVPLTKGIGIDKTVNVTLTGNTFLGNEAEARKWAKLLLRYLREETRGLYGEPSF